MNPADPKESEKIQIPDFCRAMVDASPMPMAYVDGASHTIRYANPVFHLLVGQTDRELIGDPFASCLPGSSDCLVLMDRVSRTGRAETFTGQEHFPGHPLYFSYVLWPVLAADRSQRGIMVQVTETTAFHQETIAMNEALMVGSVRQHELTETAEMLNVQLQAEILHRKQVEKEVEKQGLVIQTSEQRYRGLIEAIPQIVWTATPNGVLDFANHKWFEYFGIDLDTFNQLGWPALLHPDDREGTMQIWAAGLKSGSAFQIEHRLKNHATGNFRWYLSSAVPIGVVDGQVAKWFGTGTDMEDQKRAELAVFHKQKLESLGVLAGGLAHDFNNLLCGILGGASFIADSLPPSDSMQSILNDMIRASERAAHLTRQMLAYAGKGSFLIEQVDLNELIQSTCAMIKGSIPNHVLLTLDLRPDLLPVSADSSQMQQVAMNLILNAAESIDESKRGSVIVTTDLVKLTAVEIEETEFVTGTLAPGCYVMLQVRDNGSGINESILNKIFEPFYTTKFTGRGLGLSAVEGILRTQKGALKVQSNPQTGSTFRVYLPAVARKKFDRKRPGPSHPVESEKGSVLIVDDDEIVRRMLQLNLENGGFSVRAASGGQEALRLLQSKAEGPISLILLDLSMPSYSGKQVLQQMKALHIKVPVLICSGYSEEEALTEFVGLEIAGFIQKPFKARQLINCVMSIIDGQSPPKALLNSS